MSAHPISPALIRTRIRQLVGDLIRPAEHVEQILAVHLGAFEVLSVRLT